MVSIALMIMQRWVCWWGVCGGWVVLTLSALTSTRLPQPKSGMEVMQQAIAVLPFTTTALMLCGSCTAMCCWYMC